MDLNFVWAWIAIWLAALWVAVWQWFLIYKSMEVIGKNPKMSGFYLTTTILGIALVESAAIYGLIIAFQILSADFVNPLAAIGVWLSIGLSWLWVWIGEWLMLSGAIDAMNKDTENRNKIMTYMILFLALIESAAIYGMIVAFQLLWDLDISPYLSIGAWLAIGLAWLWAWVWEWIMAKKAIMLIWEKPKLTNFLLTITILGIALVESAAIYGLIIAFNSMEANVVDSMVAVWAWLAVWLAWLWVWIGEWLMVSWAMEAMSIGRVNKSKILTYMILFIALVESAAIYGLIISFQILSWDIAWLAAIWAWLSIWLAWLWVWIGEWILSKKSIIVIWKRPSLSMFFLTVTILGIALVESAAIYGLVVSFKILSSPEMLSLAALWAWLSIWFSALWAGIWEGVLVWWTFDAMSRNPANKSKDLTFMILFLALVEVLAIYWLIIAFKIIW
mgnify:CR=1 FL=1